jgi:ribosomal protein L35
MPKMKRSKALQKRVKVTAGGKVKARKAGHGHLLSSKSGKHLRRLRGSLIIKGRYAYTFKRKLNEL